ncbi:MAG: phenylalanine--tRNA ligase subunit alpha [Omnitrophica bacterium RIFCSPLOWO2_01_FULL_50_24]|nr:MAG: phenylalanine--tRNA ligase subunit alpha [Omnitrophica bacterium RIFCSPLOWO2_01_FULL_50_24]
MADLRALQNEVSSKIKEAQSAKAIEEIRIAFLGRKGKIANLFGAIGSLTPDRRKQFGHDLNELKSFIESNLTEKLKSLSSESKGEDPYFDPTLPGVSPRVGRLHPITQTIREISDIFVRLGFEVVDGEEIETEFHNFTALHIPLDHPSRDAFDTFYTDSGYLLRSQTSTVQIRQMKKRKPPLRIIAPGKVYRPDAVDASHSFMFHQIEGLMVDKSTAFSDLKGIIHLFLRTLFGKKVQMRFRPHFFPFTEPSVEVDVSWGKGWLELLGAGEVHPSVLSAVGYSPNRVQGFAFGLGVERIAMLKYGIHDIRLFFENDLRFLRQF